MSLGGIFAAARESRRMHVLMISDVYFPRINGVSTSIQTFRTTLARLGVRVTIVAPDYPGTNSEADADEDIQRLPSRAVPLDPEDRLMRWSHLAQLDRRLANAYSCDVDLVHVQTPFAAHYAGLRLARARGIPCIATYHTHFEEYLFHYIRFLPRSALRYAARCLARHQCNALDAIVVPSQPMAATLRDYGVAAPLHVIPTGLPESQFLRGDGKRFRQTWGIGPECEIALFVGRAAHEKNIGFLLEMLAVARRQRPALMLVIAGEGPALPALRRQAAALGIADHVRFVGYLPREGGLRDCYAAADVFTFASHTETQGLVLLEAMAAGLPVLAIAALGAAEIILPRRGAIAAADTPEAFAAQLVDLLGRPAQLAAMSGEGIAFAREWDATAQGARLATLYRQLLRTPRAVDCQQPVSTGR
ncbi:glycosyltransferase [Sulfuritalea sp.]|uniref:glycosyltransferase n=1 Tax=Sulfuritalea sp. TaxID=2480090 RepID=UPI00286D9846|nr:glycosyltransferase [Sulfuritalea sp.]